MADNTDKLNLPDEKPAEKKGFFQKIKDKFEAEEAPAVYGPAEWFEPHLSEPVDVYGSAENFKIQPDDYEDDKVEEPEGHREKE